MKYSHEILLTDEQLAQLTELEKLVEKATDENNHGMVMGQLILHGRNIGKLRLSFIDNQTSLQLIKVVAPDCQPKFI